jgi:oligosaccharyltransferase complex subunit epsilon
MPGPKTPKRAPVAASTAGASKPAPAASHSTSSSAPASVSTSALKTLWNTYLGATPSRLKLIDSFLVFLVLSGVAQFVYCVLVTNFPYNAFLAG